jgi:anti-sigma B factor antagonist
MTMLAMETDPQGRVLMKGRLDASQAAAAQAFLDRHVGVLTLDCRALDYLSSAGLGVLLKTHKRLMASGAGRLRLTGVGGHLRDIFVFSGFDRLFEIEA